MALPKTAALASLCVAWGAWGVVFAEPSAPAERVVSQAATPIGRPVIAADYVLPAYVNLRHATLLVRSTPALAGSAVDVSVRFQPRRGGRPPCGDLQTTLKPGGERRLTVEIDGWPDGDYRTDIICSRDGVPIGEPTVRWLRKQTIPEPPPATEPIDVRGLTTLFVDDEYIGRQQGLRHAVNPAETFAVTTGRMEPDRPEQVPVAGIQLEADGSWLVQFTDREREDRSGGTIRHYAARSSDGRMWRVEATGRPGRFPTGSASGADGRKAPVKDRPASLAREFSPAAPVRMPVPPTPETGYRFYDPTTDGPVDIQQVRLRHSGTGKDVRWGDIPVPYRTVWPVWQKSSAEHLVLRRQWLLCDKHDHPDGAPCDWHDTNDNFMDDFHSPDRRTMFYGQSRMILRHDPFRIPFDAFKSFRGGHYTRVLAVWRSADGIDWTPTFFDPQREDDPVGYQGYGAKQFYAEGKRLSLCYFFAYRARLQQVCVELRYSRDNIHWKRLPGGVDDTIFAANGPWGSWNFGSMFGTIGDPVEKEGWMYQLFASCQNVPHHFFRTLLGYNSQVISDPRWLREFFADNDLPSYAFWNDMGGWDGFARHAPSGCRPVGGMRYRTDGWVALQPTDREGELVTKVLLAGDECAINARTQPGGRVEVEVLDADGRPLPDFSGVHAARFTGDSVNARLAWKNGGQATLPHHPVRLRIRLDRAQLFAVHWR